MKNEMCMEDTDIIIVLKDKYGNEIYLSGGNDDPDLWYKDDNIYRNRLFNQVTVDIIPTEKKLIYKYLIKQVDSLYIKVISLSLNMDSVYIELNKFIDSIIDSDECKNISSENRTVSLCINNKVIKFKEFNLKGLNFNNSCIQITL